MDDMKYRVKPGEVVNLEWMKKHTDIIEIIGSCWSVELEKEICCTIINPYSRKPKGKN